MSVSSELQLDPPKQRFSCFVYFGFFDSPGRDLPVSLEKLDRESLTYNAVSMGVTGPDGRISTLVPDDYVMERGWYRLTFDTRGSRINTGPDYTFPIIMVFFMVSHPDNQYYITLKVSGNSYTVNVNHY